MEDFYMRGHLRFSREGERKVDFKLMDYDHPNVVDNI